MANVLLIANLPLFLYLSFILTVFGVNTAFAEGNSPDPIDEISQSRLNKSSSKMGVEEISLSLGPNYDIKAEQVSAFVGASIQFVLPHDVQLDFEISGVTGNGGDDNSNWTAVANLSKEIASNILDLGVDVDVFINGSYGQGWEPDEIHGTVQGNASRLFTGLTLSRETEVSINGHPILIQFYIGGGIGARKDKLINSVTSESSTSFASLGSTGLNLELSENWAMFIGADLEYANRVRYFALGGEISYLIPTSILEGSDVYIIGYAQHNKTTYKSDDSNESSDGQFVIRTDGIGVKLKITF